MPRRDDGDDRALPSLALVFGYIAVKDLEKVSDQIDVLTRLGYGSVEIARICGITPGGVRARRSESARKRARRRT